MTLSQLTIIDKLEVIAFCQYNDKLSSYIADIPCKQGHYKASNHRVHF